MAQILDAGEWKSRAVYNYIGVDAADLAELLRQTIDASNDEANSETEDGS